MLLYSGVNDYGEEFFGQGHSPRNLYKNDEELKFISDKLNSFLRFNVWLDAVLMRSGNYFIIKDTLVI